ncbi:MAG: c-type cytochrome [Chloroflexota bacterium]|nr:c-type cytochrome [Chloroflexota bacterium]
MSAVAHVLGDRVAYCLQPAYHMKITDRISIFLPPTARLISIAIVLVISALLFLQQIPPVGLVEASPNRQETTQPPSARNGHAIYQENCAPCHGTRGLGDGPAAAGLPDGASALADLAIARSATQAEWFTVTQEGRMEGMMPPWKDRLTDEQIRDVVAFALTLHTSNDEILRGEEIWGSECAACHGLQGAPANVSDGPIPPDLSGVAYGETISSNDWYEAMVSGHDTVTDYEVSLSEQEMWATVAYARTFSYRPMIATVLPQGSGAIGGVVTNGSAGGAPVAGLTAVLRAIQGSDEFRPVTSTVGEDGIFRFEGLPMDPSFVYLVSVEHAGLPYGGDFLRFSEGQTELDAPVTIWETSSEPGDIRLDRVQWFVDFHQGALLVGEVYRVAHDGDRVFLGNDEVVPGVPAVLEFSLPAGATAVAVDGGEIGERFFLTDAGLVDSQPLLPGQTQMLVRYLLPYDGSKAEVGHEFAYPVGELSVLVAEGAKVMTDDLEDAGTQMAGDTQFLSFVGNDVAAGQEIMLALSGLERSSAPVAKTQNTSTSVIANHPALLISLAALAAGALVGALVVPLVLRRRDDDAGERAEDSYAVDREGLEAERQRLLASIADLDDRYAAGELDDDTYQEQRMAQKRSLILVTRKLESDSLSTETADEQAAV